MSGIGTLSERTLHRAVKEYLEPDVRCQEVPVAGIVAEIWNYHAVFWFAMVMIIATLFCLLRIKDV